MEKRELTCIGCPLGCTLTVSPAGVEDLHAVGCDGFQHGDAGGQRLEG